jgi:hypothetical protein
MTEEEWLRFDLSPTVRPRRMAARLRSLGTERRVNLFGCACCRRAWPVLEERARKAVELVESHDGLPPRRVFRAIVGAGDFVPEVGWSSLGERHAARAVIGLLDGTAAHFVALAASDPWAERRAQYQLLQDVFGRPKDGPKVDPAWRLWNDGAAPALAESISRERRFGDLPVLLDALTDAGCTDEVLLSHLCGPGPHVRGCWVLDLLSGKW